MLMFMLMLLLCILSSAAIVLATLYIEEQKKKRMNEVSLESTRVGEDRIENIKITGGVLVCVWFKETRPVLKRSVV